MSFIAGINQEMCAALGLDPAYVRDVTLELRTGEPPTAVVTLYVEDEQIKKIFAAVTWREVSK